MATETETEELAERGNGGDDNGGEGEGGNEDLCMPMHAHSGLGGSEDRCLLMHDHSGLPPVLPKAHSHNDRAQNTVEAGGHKRE